MSPRHYAIAYLAAAGKDAQKQALAGCQVEWQDLVRTHIKLFKGQRAREEAKAKKM